MNKRRIADQVPAWMSKKPTTGMKAEWENAAARWCIEHGIKAKAANRIQILPTQLLMLLR